MLKYLLVSLCVLFLTCQPTMAKTVVDMDFARKIIIDSSSPQRNCESYDQYIATLYNLSKNELRQLKALIAEDLEAEHPKIIGPYPVDRRMAYGLLNRIDDLLGTLPYDLALEGRFLDYNGSGTVTYYYFKTDQGKIAEVFVGVSTIMPNYEYLENYDDHVRIFVKRGDKDNPAGYVLKIELLKPLHAEDLEPLHLKNSPDYLYLGPGDEAEVRP